MPALTPICSTMWLTMRGDVSLARTDLDSLPVKVNVSDIQVNELLPAEAKPIQRFEGSCTLWSECATRFMGVSKLVKAVLSWTLIIVPSFCTGSQI